MIDNIEDEELRIYIVARTDLDMPAGKLAAQVAHAATSTIWKTWNTVGYDIIQTYMDNAQPKIVLKAKSVDQLLAAEKACLDSGLICYTVVDAGRTVFPEPTITVLGIGPCKKSELPKYVQRLRLL